MAQNNAAVIVPGHGRFWTAAVDTLPPGQLIKITGAPTAATLTLTVNAVGTGATVVLSFAAGVTPQTRCGTIANALAALSTVTAGNVLVVPGADNYSFLVILDPAVTSPAITATATFTGGTSPAVTVSSAGRSADFSAFTEMGHTSGDSPLQVNRSGGDVTTVGSWQQDSIDQSVAAVSESLAFSALQYDLNTMKFYYGANGAYDLSGQFVTSQQSATATEVALLLILRNGAKGQPRYWPRVSISAADGENFDTTKLAEMPLQATVLASNTLAFGKGIGQVGVAA